MSNATNDAGEPQLAPGRDPTYTGMPAWVMGFIIAVVGIVVVVVAAALLVGGGHGPGRHLSLSTRLLTDQAAAAGLIDSP